jgi:phosphoglycerate dehydrogenase-like enzyme
MVLADSTRGMIGARELALLKPTAVLVNTSRGPLIDEKALVQTLTENRIAGAALDVYDTEPLPPSHPFRTLPNVVATPHIGYVTRENYQIFYNDAVEDIQAWLKGSPVRTLTAHISGFQILSPP